MLARPAAVVRFLTVSLAIIAYTAACVSERESPGALPIPSGTPIRAYAPDTDGSHRQAIKLVRTLAIEGVPTNSAILPFQSVVDLAVDRRGNIFVLDAGAGVVHGFNPDGEHLVTLGGNGQASGQLQKGSDVTVAGSVIIVHDVGRGKLVLWQIEGFRHLRDVNVTTTTTRLATIEGTSAGRLVARQVVRKADGREYQIIGLFSLDGRLLRRYLELPGRGGLANHPRREQVSQFYLPPRFTVRSDGAVIVTSIIEYDVLALTASGASLWALRADWPRETVSLPRPHAIERESSALAPALLPNGILADGRGFLYILPRSPRAVRKRRDLPSLLEPRAVDVYNRNGERVLKASIAGDVWHAARDEFVYRIEWNLETGNQIVVRERLITPF